MNEGTETGNSDLALAKENLKQAEADLQHARTEEIMAEREIEKAEHLIEKVEEELAHESRIKVNGRSHTVKGHKVSFEEVAKLAFPSGPSKPDIKYTVTFRNAAQIPAMGELDQGQSVKVKHGRNPIDETIFNVTETILS